MRRLSTFTFPLLLACVAPLAVARDVQAQQAQPLPAPDALKVAQEVQAFYNQTTTFQSDFSQEFFVKSHNVKKQSKGHVIFAKPGKMDWQYTEPKDNRVVSDGSIL